MRSRIAAIASIAALVLASACDRDRDDGNGGGGGGGYSLEIRQQLDDGNLEDL